MRKKREIVWGSFRVIRVFRGFPSFQFQPAVTFVDGDSVRDERLDLRAEKLESSAEIEKV
jgi:hypothetical protein